MFLNLFFLHFFSLKKSAIRQKGKKNRKIKLLILSKLYCVNVCIKMVYGACSRHTKGNLIHSENTLTGYGYVVILSDLLHPFIPTEKNGSVQCMHNRTTTTLFSRSSLTRTSVDLWTALQDSLCLLPPTNLEALSLPLIALLLYIIMLHC